MECSIRLCVVFPIRAVADHTCECSIAESCLKRDKCLSQANKTMQLPWVKTGAQSILQNQVPLKKICCDSPPVQWEVVSVLMLLWVPPWKLQWRDKTRTGGRRNSDLLYMTWRLCSRCPGQIYTNFHHWLNDPPCSPQNWRNAGSFLLSPQHQQAINLFRGFILLIYFWPCQLICIWAT